MLREGEDVDVSGAVSFHVLQLKRQNLGTTCPVPGYRFLQSLDSRSEGHITHSVSIK